MADINQFRIIKELYTGEQLTVYQVEDMKNGELGILRLIHQVPVGDGWYQLYRNYKTNIPPHRFLPAVKTLDVWERKPFVVLDGSEGHFLEKDQVLTGKQIDQFIDAVAHLHNQSMYHGKINRFNIWIKENGEIALYGAGERSVLQADRKITSQDDLKQVISILKNHSTISESHFEGRGFERIEELQEWVLRKLAIPKPGLVNLGDTTQPLFGAVIKEPNKNEEPKIASPEPVVTSPSIEKKKSNFLTIGIAVIAIVLIVVFSMNWLRNGSEKTSTQAIENKQVKDLNKAEQKPEAVVKKTREADISQYAKLLSGWELIKGDSIKLADKEYTLIATAQKQDDSTGLVKIFVVSEGKKAAESPEYKGSLSSESNSYIDSFLTVTSENGQKGLLVFELPSGLISEVIALEVQANGMIKQVWSDYGTEVIQKNEVISVKGTGLTNLSLKNNQFTLEKTKE